MKNGENVVALVECDVTDTATGRMVAEFPSARLHGAEGPWTHVVCAPAGRLLAASGRCETRVVGGVSDPCRGRLAVRLGEIETRVFGDPLAGAVRGQELADDIDHRLVHVVDAVTDGWEGTAGEAVLYARYA